MKYWFVFNRHDLLLERTSDGQFTIPCSNDAPVDIPQDANVINVNPTINDIEVKTFNTSNIEISNHDKYEMCDLRSSYYKLSHELYIKAGKCHELLYWDSTTRFCGICGTPMQMHTDISKKCPNCGKEVWPQLATAIIVLISNGDNVVLVHAKNFKKPFYGLVAGFVETGETLEEAVQREVMEETSLKIKNITYYASQPWPYPCGLMVGFYAEYDGGDLALQEKELAYGGWFNRHDLPTIPEKLSLARMLIDHWLESFDDYNKEEDK